MKLPMSRRRLLFALVGIATPPLVAACAAPPAATATPAKPAEPAAGAPKPAAATRPTAAQPAADAGGAPTRPVELVISTNPGGGSDLYARFIIGIIEKHGLSPQPFLPINKDGGAGAVAMQYVAGKKADGHTIMITLNSFFTTPMLQKLPFTMKGFTPIALLALDSFFLWVPEDSPYKTFGDFLKDAKEKELTVGGTGTKQEDEVLFKLIEQQGSTKPFKYVPFKGGGDVATALAGKQVDATVNNPSETQPFYPGKVRPLAAFLDERPAAYRELPTAKELGLPITYFNMRGIVGPPEVAAEPRRWMSRLMKQVFDSADWQEYLKKNVLEPQFMDGDDYAKFLDDYEKLHRELVSRAGWLQ